MTTDELLSWLDLKAKGHGDKTFADAAAEIRRLMAIVAKLPKDHPALKGENNASN